MIAMPEQLVPTPTVHTTAPVMTAGPATVALAPMRTNVRGHNQSATSMQPAPMLWAASAASAMLASWGMVWTAKVSDRVGH